MRRSWFEWKKPMVDDLLQQIQESDLRRDKEDEWVWKVEDNFEYIVRSTYKRTRNKLRGEDDTMFNIFWKVEALQLKCALGEYYLIGYQHGLIFSRKL